MAKYNPDVHHRRSIRLRGYDYSQAGLYFITICAFDKRHLFGEISNGEMMLNAFGNIAKNEWAKTGEIRKNIDILEYIIMPNHMHGIILICDTVGAYGNTPDAENQPRTNVGAYGHTPLHGEHDKPRPFKSPSKNIGAIVRGYKSTVTKQINIMRQTPGAPVWQRNYYEHIIRNEKSYFEIAEYIRTNPLKWRDDKYYA